MTDKLNKSALGEKLPILILLITFVINCSNAQPVASLSSIESLRTSAQETLDFGQGLPDLQAVSLGQGADISNLLQTPKQMTGEENNINLQDVAPVPEIREFQPEPLSVEQDDKSQAVVNIVMRKKWWKRTMFIDDDFQGTGFMIDSSGIIITNQHVVSGYTPDWTINIHFRNGRKAEGKLLTCDGAKDWAVIKVEAKHPLPYIKIGDSSSLKVGEQVCTIGHPHGYKWRQACGAVIKLPEPGSVPLLDGSRWLIMTNIDTWSGNSGGPLVNSQGEVVGIIQSVAQIPPSMKTVSYAVPIDSIKTCSLSESPGN